MQSLVKAFGDVTAMDGISFEVRAGEIFALLGPNGAGKTTTIQMLTTLLRPTSGTMALDGLDPVANPRDVRRCFGIVFQDPSLDGDLTAYGNMELHGVLYLVLTVCLIAGFRPNGLAAVPLALLFMALIAIVFTALGTAIGSTLRDMQGFQLIMNFLVMPIFFLSGALFPLAGLPTALALATRVDPLSYGIDGLRGALVGLSHFGVMTDLAILCAVASCFLALGARAFSRIQI